MQDELLNTNTRLPQLTAGVDEAGRGPLVGNVVAAAVILDASCPIVGLADSKKLSVKKRELLFEQIYQHARAVAIGRASATEIDQINILQASLLAMQRAVDALPIEAELVLVDGNRCPQWRYSSSAVIGGDGIHACIAAASIIAKVTRDREMAELEQRYPGYGFAQHKGYPTKAHYQALEQLGPCAQHRRSFKPVARVLNNS